jgi:putative flavoprotein involved in K+ transport
MQRDEIVGYLERYASGFDAPVKPGMEVLSLSRGGDGFALDTSEGPIVARNVVICTGAYQRPHRPAGGSSIASQTFAIDVEDYRNGSALPPGPVLIVGSGQSGCQIAEELQDEGRDVVLACGRAPWFSRRVGERDLMWWVVETGFWNASVTTLASPEARLFANILATGHGGGHDMHLRTLQARGIRLTGHFIGVEDGLLAFATDLNDSVAWGDARYQDFAALIRKTALQKGLSIPEMPPPSPFSCETLRRLPLNHFGAVIFAGGFRPDYQRWVHLDGAFDEMGFPIQVDGASTVVPGLYFVGVHFLRKRQSSLLYGVGEDARIVARAIAGQTAVMA